MGWAQDEVRLVCAKQDEVWLDCAKQDEVWLDCAKQDEVWLDCAKQDEEVPLDSASILDSTSIVFQIVRHCS